MLEDTKKKEVLLRALPLEFKLYLNDKGYLIRHIEIKQLIKELKAYSDKLRLDMQEDFRAEFTHEIKFCREIITELKGH